MGLHLGRGGVTRDDVLWCYRTLLEREPESEGVVRQHMLCRDFRTLAQAFVTSEEFVVRKRRLFRPLPLREGVIDVDLAADRLPLALERMRLAWTHLGTDRAHHSVLTNDAFLPQNLPSSIAHFWASGEQEAEQVFATIASNGMKPDELTCVEFGCGVGRVTGALARRFARVVAYDISPAHLARAAERMTDLGLANVHLVACTESVLESIEACDFVYTRLVLQHNPPPLMNLLVRSLLRALSPGGLAIFQLPTFGDGYSFSLDAWLTAPQPLDMEMHCLPQRYVFRAVADTGCTVLQVIEDESAGNAGLVSNTFIVKRPPAVPATDR